MRACDTSPYDRNTTLLPPPPLPHPATAQFLDQTYCPRQRDPPRACGTFSKGGRNLFLIYACVCLVDGQSGRSSSPKNCTRQRGNDWSTREYLLHVVGDEHALRTRRFLLTRKFPRPSAHTHNIHEMKFENRDPTASVELRGPASPSENTQ